MWIWLCILIAILPVAHSKEQVPYDTPSQCKWEGYKFIGAGGYEPFGSSDHESTCNNLVHIEMPWSYHTDAHRCILWKPGQRHKPERGIADRNASCGIFPSINNGRCEFPGLPDPHVCLWKDMAFKTKRTANMKVMSAFDFECEEKIKTMHEFAEYKAWTHNSENNQCHMFKKGAKIVAVDKTGAGYAKYTSGLIASRNAGGKCSRGPTCKDALFCNHIDDKLCSETAATIGYSMAEACPIKCKAACPDGECVWKDKWIYSGRKKMIDDIKLQSGAKPYHCHIECKKRQLSAGCEYWTYSEWNTNVVNTNSIRCKLTRPVRGKPPKGRKNLHPNLGSVSGSVHCKLDFPLNQDTGLTLPWPTTPNDVDGCFINGSTRATKYDRLETVKMSHSAGISGMLACQALSRFKWITNGKIYAKSFNYNWVKRICHIQRYYKKISSDGPALETVTGYPDCKNPPTVEE